MTWYSLEQQGWNWSTGRNHGGYYAQAWRDLKPPKQVGGRWMYRECFTERGRDIEQATRNLWQRLEQLQGELDA